MTEQRYQELYAKYFESHPQKYGGTPVIRDTRMPIWGLAQMVSMGETTETLLEDYPNVPVEAHAFAVEWAKRNPRSDDNDAEVAWLPGRAEPPGRQEAIQADGSESASAAPPARRSIAAASRTGCGEPYPRPAAEPGHG